MEDLEGHEASIEATSLSPEALETHKQLHEKLYKGYLEDEMEMKTDHADIEGSTPVQDDVYKILGDSEDASDSLSRRHAYEETLLPAYSTWLETSMVFMTHMWTTTSDFCQNTWATIAKNFSALPHVEAVAVVVVVTVFAVSLLFLW